MKCYSVIKKDIISFAGKWMELEIILSASVDQLLIPI
jgi:hypothetical protein